MVFSNLRRAEVRRNLDEDQSLPVPPTRRSQAAGTRPISPNQPIRGHTHALFGFSKAGNGLRLCTPANITKGREKTHRKSEPEKIRYSFAPRVEGTSDVLPRLKAWASCRKRTSAPINGIKATYHRLKTVALIGLVNLLAKVQMTSSPA